MARIARIGHVGIHVKDLETSTRFYRDVLGLTVTDAVPETGPVFLSAQPDEEHHELVLLPGRDAGDSSAKDGPKIIQQISFRCHALDNVIAYYNRLRAEKVKFDFVVSHGNAVGVYFFDPDGNRIEIYCDTGLKARQPYAEAIDLSRPAAEVMAFIKASVDKHHATGFLDRASIAAQQKAWEAEGLH